MEAVVSETFVLKQIKDVIEFRETWLRRKNLPMDFQMRDGEGFERKEFLQWAKNQYHAQEYQQKLQQEDLKNEKDVQNGKKSRWDRDLQRRLGTAQFWYMVRVRR